MIDYKNKTLIISTIYFIFLSFYIYASDYQNSNDFFLEIQYANYVQKIIEKIIPNSFVSVKLYTKQDSTFLNTNNFNLDKQASLPGLPIGKKTTYIPIDNNLKTILPSKIISKDIKIFIPSSIQKDKLDQLKNQITNMLNLSENDLLELTYYQSLNEAKKTKFNFFDYVYILLILIFIINFRSGLRYLARVIRKSSLSTNGKSESPIVFPKGEINITAKETVHKSNNDILKVKLIREKNKTNTESYDFSFLNDLSFEKLMELLKDESIEDLPIILSMMPDDFCVYFCNNYTGPMEKLIKVFYTIKDRPKIDLKLIRVSLYQKYIKLLERDTVKFNGEKRLAEIIKRLPYSRANQILNYIKDVNNNSFKKLKDDLITIDKIKKLDNILIEEIVSKLDHNIFIKFLKISDNEIKYKFYSTFSDEVVEYLEKELDELEPLTNEERDNVIDSVLSVLKKVLRK
jgi:flagellar motor switch protein FliG